MTTDERLAAIETRLTDLLDQRAREEQRREAQEANAALHRESVLQRLTATEHAVEAIADRMPEVDKNHTQGVRLEARDKAQREDRKSDQARAAIYLSGLAILVAVLGWLTQAGVLG